MQVSHTTRDRSKITLVLGGQRSGKSRFAEGLALATGLRPVYVATGVASDAEMQARIEAHEARRGNAWRTIEAPLDLPPVIAVAAGPDGVVLVDCLSIWVANLLVEERPVETAYPPLLEALEGAKGPVVLVSTEANLGIVPMNALARRFVDATGLLHQEVAAVADRVATVTAGLPHWLKKD